MQEEVVALISFKGSMLLFFKVIISKGFFHSGIRPAIIKIKSANANMVLPLLNIGSATLWLVQKGSSLPLQAPPPAASHSCGLFNEYYFVFPVGACQEAYKVMFAITSPRAFR